MFMSSANPCKTGVTPGGAGRLRVLLAAATFSLWGCSSGTGDPYAPDAASAEGMEPVTDVEVEPAVPARAIATTDFVTRNGTRLEVAGSEFKFAGSNNYYLMYGSRLMVDDVLEVAARAGFNTMRTWGFLDIGNQDGTSSVRGPSSGVYFQYWDGSGPAYNDGPSGL